MTTSGTFTFDPTIAGIYDEAFEQAGIDPQSINERHIASANMSMNLMFTEWAAIDGDALYRVANSSSTIVGSSTYDAANAHFSLDTGGIDIVDMNMDYASSGSVEPMTRISRQQYINIPDNTVVGKPESWYLDRTTLNAPKIYLWPVPDATVIFYYDYMRYVQTVTALNQTPDVERLWLAAVMQGLAARIAFKFNMPKYNDCATLAERSYRIARRAGSGSTSIIIKGRGFGASGRTMRGLAVGSGNDTGGR